VARVFTAPQGPVRWLALVPVLPPLLFVGHALEDGGLLGALPLATVAVLCLVQSLRPTVLGWVFCMSPWLAYTVLVVVQAMQNPAAEMAFFLLIAILPCGALWLARPRRLEQA
jgi:hypothetical protein